MQELAKTLKQIAGVSVEVTVRGLQSFTFSTDEMNVPAAQRIADFFQRDNRAKIEVEHDDCGSFVYVDII